MAMCRWGRLKQSLLVVVVQNPSFGKDARLLDVKGFDSRRVLGVKPD